MPTSPNSLKYEFIGTITVVFCGLAFVAIGGNEFRPYMEGLAYFISLVILHPDLVFVVGHFNPAVTVGRMITVYFTAPKWKGLTHYLPIFLVQFLGGFTGAFLVWALTGTRTYKGLGLPLLGVDFSPENGLCTEVIFSTLLIFIHLELETLRFYFKSEFGSIRIVKALILWFATTAFVFVAGHVSGANLNPFRFLGGALIVEDFGENWKLYLFAPFIGSLIASAGVVFQVRLIEAYRIKPSRLHLD